MLWFRQVVAPAAGAMAAALWLSSACAQSADPIFGSIAGAGGGWLAGARAGYEAQRGPATGGSGTDASATRLGGPMSSAGGASADAPRSADTAATSGWIAWSGLAPLAPGQFGSGGGFASGFSPGFTTFGLGLASLQLATRPGAVSGGGVEYLVRPDLGVSFGYQQIDLGTLATGDAMRALTQTSATRLQSVSAGVNWRVTPNATLSLGVTGHFAGTDTDSQSRSAWDNGGDAISSASIVAAPR